MRVRQTKQKLIDEFVTPTAKVSSLNKLKRSTPTLELDGNSQSNAASSSSPQDRKSETSINCTLKDEKMIRNNTDDCNQSIILESKNITTSSDDTNGLSTIDSINNDTVNTDES